MSRSAIAPWLAAGISGLLIVAPVQAGIFGHLFSRHHQQEECGQEQGCQQPCPQCQACAKQCQKPEKKKHICCFNPPEPPRGRVGTSFAADPQASFPEADQQAQPRDDRFDKVEKDLTRLTLIVEQMLKASSPNAQETTPQEPPVPMPPNTPATRLDPIPPGPIPASARNFAPRRLSPVPTLAVPPVEATASR